MVVEFFTVKNVRGNAGICSLFELGDVPGKGAGAVSCKIIDKFIAGVDMGRNTGVGDSFSDEHGLKAYHMTIIA